MAATIVQPLLLQLLRDDISRHVDHAFVNINGQPQTFPIFKTDVNGMRLTIYIYLDDTVQGNIQSFSLMDSTGNTLAIKPVSVTKVETGLLIAFEFEVKVEVKA
ncbi:hypothetical protein DFP93_103205 [Aneurinibacillus soli]|uniref:Uncharacterized protein n=1 Tax=Aneurinibacillus soli TaxID=1500254 RepID=A0A0U4NJK9_9BACL|nr:hypothetical protein [Aneurinibacillus soli]PYE62993.1 hypothetical protein DFP93_103205 [Aneurinibacillus soli]BAU28948.1 hypothetical protein CB4_03125 [Aneurinibacillus soli]